jgi:CTP-dependent riboflavin kinase
MFDLSMTGKITMAIDDPRTRSDAEKCAGRIASGLGWARLYLSNEGYTVETIYE